MVLGIVAEYNPFHNGHLYHLLKSKEKADADTVVAIIGGNFTQRGEASIVDKWTKAEIALKNGIDLVIELPTLYSVSSVENFANLRDNFVKQFGDPQESGLIWVPQNLIECSEDTKNSIIKMIDLLEDNDDVQHVYSNVSL